MDWLLRTLCPAHGSPGRPAPEGLVKVEQVDVVPRWHAQAPASPEENHAAAAETDQACRTNIARN